MRLPFIPSAAVALFAVLPAGAEPARIEVVRRDADHELDLRVDGKLAAGYRYAPTLRKPYLYPIVGPSGKSVTPENPPDHPHHNGIFAAAETEGGALFWQGTSKDRIRHVKFGRAEAADGQAVLETECVWETPAGGAASPAAPGVEAEFRGIIDDRRMVTFTPLGGGEMFLDYAVALTAREDVQFRKVTHMAFPQCRVTIPMSVKGGGKKEAPIAGTGAIVNSHGDVNEKGTYGKAADWCDYSGSNEGAVEGIAVFSHPKLSAPWHPPPWFTRDYGPFSPNPWLFAEDDAARRIAKGQTMCARWGILIHRGDVKAGRVAERYEAYVRKEMLTVGD